MIRTREELLKSDYSFITLTYRNETIPRVTLDNGEERATLSREHIALFLNSYRHWFRRRDCAFPRYFLCGEYGSKTFRPHYHLLLGTQDAEAISWCCSYWRMRYGLVDCKPVAKSLDSFEKSARYVAKYVAKAPLENRTRLLPPMVHPFLLHSREWGSSLFNRLPRYEGDLSDYSRVEAYVTQQINKTSVGNYRYKLPKYYRKRLQDGILYNQVQGEQSSPHTPKTEAIKRYREVVEKVNTIGSLQREFGLTNSEAHELYNDPNFVFPTRSPLDEANTESRLKAKRLQAEAKDRF